jgi:dihydroneopterin aldolase
MLKDIWAQKEFISINISMVGEMTIELKEVKFFGYHGVYLEEKKTGGEFEINLSVSFSPSKKIQSVAETINYENLFELLKEEMKQPRELLETLTMEICERLQGKFPSINNITIEIVKLNPPIEGFTGTVSAKYSKEF